MRNTWTKLLSHESKVKTTPEKYRACGRHCDVHSTQLLNSLTQTQNSALTQMRNTHSQTEVFTWFLYGFFRKKEKDKINKEFTKAELQAELAIRLLKVSEVIFTAVSLGVHR